MINMDVLLYSLISAFILAGLSLVGFITLVLSEKIIKKILIFLVSFSAGTLMGGAFLFLIPNAFEQASDFLFPSIYILTGFSLFFILERVLHWHHCHKYDCEISTHLGHMNLAGNVVHNLVDGLVIVSTFTVSPQLGIPVVLSMAMHEIPQEISDIGVLLYSGFEKRKALIYNFIVSLSVVVGVILGFFLADKIQGMNQFLIPFAAGGFIYIAASDLIPELKQETDLAKSLLSFLVFIFGLGMMLMFRLLSQ